MLLIIFSNMEGKGPGTTSFAIEPEALISYFKTLKSQT